MLYSLRDVSKRFGLDYQNMVYWVHQGILPKSKFRIGRTYAYDVETIGKMKEILQQRGKIELDAKS